MAQQEQVDEYFAEHVKSMVTELTILIMQGHSADAARNAVARLQERLFSRHPDALAERLQALSRAYDVLIERQNQVQYLQRRAIRYGREHWYLGPAPEGSLWDVHRQHLRTIGRQDDEIDTVDEDSGIVVGLLDNPKKADFSTRGLVVGHVQSGKTGNIAAVINKAAETPYKFFLVLSGLTDQLRNQTQARLERDVIKLAPDRWMTWTSQNTYGQNGDFSERAVGGFSFDHRNQLAVIKKNSAVLRRFLLKLNNTSKVTLSDTPFLIIDDECDQASVNSARYQSDVTRINGLIRKMIQKVPRVAYVGYTATPFANVLIDPAIPEDLYPRNFIHALQRPAKYFGAEELFGRSALEGEYSETDDGYDMIRVIPEEEITHLRVNGDQASRVRMTPAIMRAVRYFMMVVAARRVRGQQDASNTMLVHTSLLQRVHTTTAAAVGRYVDSLREDVGTGSRELLDVLSAEWDEEQNRVRSGEFGLEPVLFSQLESELSRVLADVKVHVENWRATERLEYSASAPRTVIVIGGNVLARGLTLEGLSVSFFLRSSSQYDTLMQMGRWFGYREGFEDLPRVWVEERVRDAFFDLATLESEIRRDIARYAEEEISPETFAVRIRKIPGMTITAPAKMRAAVAVEIGFAGTHVQTIRFYRNNKELLQSNWKAAADLLSSISSGSAEQRVFLDVSAENVLKFLANYTAHETHRSLSAAFLMRFIEKAVVADPRMVSWSVVVVGGQGGTSTEPLGALGHVETVIRSAEADSTANASVKALMSRRDLLLDLDIPTETVGDVSWEALKALREKEKAPPLLLLYPIQAKSTPVRQQKQHARKPREALNASFDVLGYGIVFPGDRQLSATYVSAPVSPELEEPEDHVSAEDDIPEELLSGTEQENAS